jgi:hypothetical protein
MSLLRSEEECHETRGNYRANIHPLSVVVPSYSRFALIAGKMPALPAKRSQRLQDFGPWTLDEGLALHQFIGDVVCFEDLPQNFQHPADVDGD